MEKNLGTHVEVTVQNHAAPSPPLQPLANGICEDHCDHSKADGSEFGQDDVESSRYFEHLFVVDPFTLVVVADHFCYYCCRLVLSALGNILSIALLHLIEKQTG